MSLDALVQQLVAAEITKLRAELAREGSGDDWIPQGRSPLGRRLHCALWRDGVLPGVKVHRRVLVRRKDLDAYIAEHGVPAPVPSSKPKDGEAAAFAKSRSGVRRVA